VASTLTQRIKLEGGEKIRAELDKIAKAGKEAIAELRNQREIGPAANEAASGVDRLNQSVEKSVSSFTSAGASIGGFIKNIGLIGAAATAAVGALAGLTKGVASTIQQQSNTARNIGLNINQLREIEATAKAFGASEGVITKSLEIIQQAVGKSLFKANKDINGFRVTANGGFAEAGKSVQELTKQLNEFGTLKPFGKQLQISKLLDTDQAVREFNRTKIAIDETSKELTDFEKAMARLPGVVLSRNGDPLPLVDVFKQIADEIGRIPDFEQQAEVAMLAFGDAWKELLPIFRAGSKEIDGILATLRKASVGKEITDEAVKSATELQKQFTILEFALSQRQLSFRAKFLDFFTQPLTFLVNSFIRASTEADKALASIRVDPATGKSFGDGLKKTFESPLADFMAFLKENGTALGKYLTDLGKSTDNLLLDIFRTINFRVRDGELTFIDTEKVSEANKWLVTLRDNVVGFATTVRATYKNVIEPAFDGLNRLTSYTAELINQLFNTNVTGGQLLLGIAIFRLVGAMSLLATASQAGVGALTKLYSVFGALITVGAVLASSAFDGPRRALIEWVGTLKGPFAAGIAKGLEYLEELRKAFVETFFGAGNTVRKGTDSIIKNLNDQGDAVKRETDKLQEEQQERNRRFQFVPPGILNDNISDAEKSLAPLRRFVKSVADILFGGAAQAQDASKKMAEAFDLTGVKGALKFPGASGSAGLGESLKKPFEPLADITKLIREFGSSFKAVFERDLVPVATKAWEIFSRLVSVLNVVLWTNIQPGQAAIALLALKFTGLLDVLKSFVVIVSFAGASVFYLLGAVEKLFVLVPLFFKLFKGLAVGLTLLVKNIVLSIAVLSRSLVLVAFAAARMQTLTAASFARFAAITTAVAIKAVASLAAMFSITALAAVRLFVAQAILAMTRLAAVTGSAVIASVARLTAVFGGSILVALATLSAAATAAFARIAAVLTGTVLVGVGQLAVALTGTLAVAFARVTAAASTLLARLAAAPIAVAGIIAAFVLLYKYSDVLIDSIKKNGFDFGKIFEDLRTNILRDLGGVGTVIGQQLDKLPAGVKESVIGFAKAFGGINDAVAGELDKTQKIVDKTRIKFPAPELQKEAAKTPIDFEVRPKFGDEWALAFARLKPPVLSDPWFEQQFSSFKSGIEAARNGLADFFSFADKQKEKLKGLFAIPEGGISFSWFTEALSAAVATAQDLLLNVLPSYAQQGLSAVESAISGIAASIQSYVNDIIAAVEAAKAAVASLPSGPSGGGGGDPGFASGGYVRGRGTGTSDSIPAWLSNGEFVIRASAVRQYGVQFLNMINGLRFNPSKGRTRFAMGGLVDTASRSLGLSSPGSALSPAMPGKSFDLVINGERFSDLYAPESTAASLSRYATAAATRSAGRKPNWYK